MFSLHVVLGIAILGKPGLHIFFINLITYDLLML